MVQETPAPLVFASISHGGLFHHRFAQRDKLNTELKKLPKLEQNDESNT
jgi:hypothetical protein